MSGASIILVVACVAAAEGVLRHAAPDYLEGRAALSIDRLHRYSEVYGWELRPGARQRENEHWTTVNGLGYRGREVGAQPAAGRARVVMLGDSIAFGTYVGDGETFADQLDAGTRLEIVNLAVQGYGFGQNLLKLEREGLAYRPDVVVLNVCLANDFADSMLPSFLYDARHPKPYFRIEDGRLVLHDEHLRLGTLARIGRRLHERSHLYNRVLDWLAPAADAAPGGAPAGAWVTRRNEALRDEAAARTLGLRLVARMRAAAETHGATFVVVLHPDKEAFRNGSTWIEAFYAEPELAGLTIVDMGREYRRAGLAWADLMRDGLGHLNPAGHRHAAAILGGTLLYAADGAGARRHRPQALQSEGPAEN